MKLLSFFATVFMISSVSAFAGVKEGGGDVGLLLQCKSLPTVDSEVKVTITGAAWDAPLSLLATAGEKISVNDQGRFAWGSGRYLGEIFEIRFDSEKRATIIALKSNAFMNAGDSENLVCDQYPGA